MDKETRNTAIIIIIVLVVSTISLVAIVSTIWQLIGPGVNQLGDIIGLTLKESLIDYNFTVPPLNEPQERPAPSEPTPTATDQKVGQRRIPLRPKSERPIAIGTTTVVPANYTYNFSIPGQGEVVDPKLPLEAIAPTPSSILENTGWFIRVPKLDLLSAIWSGGSQLRSQTQDKGFWIHPNSTGASAGETILFCDRNSFTAVDQRSCHDIHLLEPGNKIQLDDGDRQLDFTVTGVKIVDTDSSSIFSVNDGSNYLKLVANHPRNSYSQYLVVLAAKDTD